MNFFKSVFSDDLDPPQTDSESDSESQSHLINEERKNPDPESSPDGSNPKPNPTSNDDGDGDGDGKGEGDGDDNDNDDGAGGGGGGGGGWSFGGFIKTLTTKSETVIETYRRDLQEFGTELKKEIEVAQGSLGNVGNVIDEFGNTVMKGTAQIISQGKDVLLAGDHESDSSDSNSNTKIGTPNSLNSKGYSRFDSQIRVIQGDMNTYLESPEDVEDYSTWKLGFVLEEKSDEMERLIDENGNLGSIYKRLVPTSVDSETFWCRYFYRVHKLQQAEDLRANLVKRAITDEEELSWDVDDDDEEEEEEEDDDEVKEKENTKEVSKSKLKVNEEMDSNYSEEVVKHDDSKAVDEIQVSNPSKELVDEEKDKEEHSDEKTGNASSEVADEEKEEVSGVDDEPRKENNAELGTENVDWSLDKEVSESKSEEKASLGEKCVSVISTHEEEDLGWDEIEDMSSIDDKKVSHSSNSPNREDLRKRLSAAEEDEDLSWDIEDED